MCKHRNLLLLIPALFALAAQAQTPDVVESPRGETVERNLPTDEPLRPWAHDPNLLQKESGDRVELRPVHAERLATVKLTDVVPPIRFASGLADIAQSYIESLRKTLDDLRDKRNVRLRGLVSLEVHAALLAVGHARLAVAGIFRLGGLVAAAGGLGSVDRRGGGGHETGHGSGQNDRLHHHFSLHFPGGNSVSPVKH
jgi:hypothetical protein